MVSLQDDVRHVETFTTGTLSPSTSEIADRTVHWLERSSLLFYPQHLEGCSLWRTRTRCLWRGNATPHRPTLGLRCLPSKMTLLFLGLLRYEEFFISGLHATTFNCRASNHKNKLRSTTELKDVPLLLIDCEFSFGKEWPTFRFNLQVRGVYAYVPL